MQLSKTEIPNEKPDFRTENIDLDHDRDHRNIIRPDDRPDQVHDHRIDLLIEMVENTQNVIHHIETENNQDSDFIRKCFNRFYYMFNQKSDILRHQDETFLKTSPTM